MNNLTIQCSIEANTVYQYALKLIHEGKLLRITNSGTKAWRELMLSTAKVDESLANHATKLWSLIPAEGVMLCDVCGRATLPLPQALLTTWFYQAKALKDANPQHPIYAVTSLQTLRKLVGEMIAELVISLPAIRVETKEGKSSQWLVSNVADPDIYPCKGLRLPEYKARAYKKVKVSGDKINRPQSITYTCQDTLTHLQSIPLRYNQEVLKDCPFKEPDTSEDTYAKWLETHHTGEDDPSYEVWKAQQLKSYYDYVGKFEPYIKAQGTEVFYNTYEPDSRGRLYVANDLGNHIGIKPLRGVIEFADKGYKASKEDMNWLTGLLLN